MAMNNPYGGGGMGPGGFSGGPPTAPPIGGGYSNAPNPLNADEYQQALLRAMALAGIRPGSISPIAEKVREKGRQAVQELILQLGQEGPAGQAAAVSPNDMLNRLAAIIKRGLRGEKIFGGPGKEGALQNLAGLVEKAAGGGLSSASLGEQVLAAILGSPTSASNLFQEARYGGLAEPFQRVAARGLEPLLDTYFRQQEQNPEGNAGGLLRLLLGGAQLPAAGPLTQLPSQMGTPTPGQGQPLGPGGVPAFGAQRPGGVDLGGAPGVMASPLGQGNPPISPALSPYNLQGAGFGQQPNPLAALAALQAGQYMGGGGY